MLTKLNQPCHSKKKQKKHIHSMWEFKSSLSNNLLCNNRLDMFQINFYISRYRNNDLDYYTACLNLLLYADIQWLHEEFQRKHVRFFRIWAYYRHWSRAWPSRRAQISLLSTKSRMAVSWYWRISGESGLSFQNRAVSHQNWDLMIIWTTEAS